MLPLVARIFALSALTGITASVGAVTVFAEDFSTGNPAAGTAYTLIAAGSFSNPGQYRVVANPATDLINGYVSYFDRTVGTASGQMLFFNGANGPSAIWQRSANLIAGAAYTFSYWGSSGSSTNNPALNLLIDGIAGPTLPTTAGAWASMSQTFTPMTSGVRVFSIIDQNFIGVGNDGAIDDILLTTTAVPEPAKVALMLAGMAMLWSRTKR